MMKRFIYEEPDYEWVENWAHWDGNIAADDRLIAIQIRDVLRDLYDAHQTGYGTEILDRLIDLAGQVEKVLAGNSAIANIVNNTKVKVPEISVRLDPVRLAQFGIEPGPALDTLQAAGFGLEAGRIVREKEEIGVWIRMETRARDLTALKQLPVRTQTGSWVPLSRVADITIRHSPAAITRLNGRREITLLAEVNGNIPSVVAQLRRAFQSIDLPPGYSIDFTGQYQTLIQTVKELLFVVLAAIVLIYIILVMQFGSWRQPLILLLTIPFALVGALLALFVTRQGVNISVGMGAVTLVGIAVNNAVVLMDCANRKMAAGQSVVEALSSAASVRLRPILLTTLTTIAALLPAAIGTGAGSHVFQAFAITVIGGLLAATFATLILVPVLSALLSSVIRS